MQIHISEKKLKYDGSQLSSHFAYKAFGLRGDSLVVFQGPMDIPKENIADLEDLRQNKIIRGSKLLHFIAEHFGITLETAVLRQRMLVRLAADIIREARIDSPGQGGVSVRGDDIYVEEGKLSVSIAAPSPVSCLIHFGVNISTRNVPVEASSLEILGVEPGRVAQELSEAYAKEIESIERALSKVKGVR